MLHNLDEEDVNGGEIRVGARPGENILLKMQRRCSPQSSEIAKNARNAYTYYFNNEGAVSWQEKII